MNDKDYEEEIAYLRSKANYYKGLDYRVLEGDFNKAADMLESLFKKEKENKS